MTEKVLQLNNQRNIVWSLVVAILFLGAMYMYLVQQTVYNVVERQQTEESLSEIHAKVGELESRYVFYKNNIDLAYAQSLGFEVVDEPSFITRKSVSVSLNTFQ